MPSYVNAVLDYLATSGTLTDLVVATTKVAEKDWQWFKHLSGIIGL